MNRYRVAIVCIMAVWTSAGSAGDLEILRSLNTNSDQPSVGAVVDFDGMAFSTVVDLLGDAPLNVPVGWTRSQHLEPRFVSLRGKSIRCINCRWVESESMWLWSGDLIETKLSNPFQTLEVFNRRLTGLANNEEAELRVLQWRSSIRELLEDGRKVFLVTEVVSGKDPKLVAVGRSSEESVALQLRLFCKDLSFLPISDELVTVSGAKEVRCEMSVKSPVEVSVTLRRIVFGDDSLTPSARYNFAFGEQATVKCRLSVPRQ
jgi:hypothetical protein